VPQPYSALAPVDESVIQSDVPPTPVTQALVAGQEPEPTPLFAANPCGQAAPARREHHIIIIVRLLSPGPWLVGTTKVYLGVGADIVMESITLTYHGGQLSKSANAC
jgi:hypothetical protein